MLDVGGELFFFCFFQGGGGRLVVDAIVSLWRFWYGVGVEVSLYWIPLFELNFFTHWITFLIPLLHPKPELKLTPPFLFPQVQMEMPTPTPLPHQLPPQVGDHCPTVSQTQTRCSDPAGPWSMPLTAC